VNSVLTAAVLLALGAAGCAHASRRVYVPNRCIQKVKWGRPCEAVSESLIKCDAVMVTVSCVSVAGERGGKIAREKFAE
jgi:hypothetical protein